MGFSPSSADGLVGNRNVQMAANRMQVLKLYKTLLRESSKFSAYNYRCYALRRVRDAFHENKTISDPEAIAKELSEGYRNLEMIKRQVIVGQMFTTPKLVIENPKH